MNKEVATAKKTSEHSDTDIWLKEIGTEIQDVFAGYRLPPQGVVLYEDSGSELNDERILELIEKIDDAVATSARTDGYPFNIQTAEPLETTVVDEVSGERTDVLTYRDVLSTVRGNGEAVTIFADKQIHKVDNRATSFTFILKDGAGYIEAVAS